MIYRIRVALDAEEEIFRDINIKASQTLWHLHTGIKNAFNLSGEEFASFCYVDKDMNQIKEIPVEDPTDDQSGLSMADIDVKEAFSEEEKAQLIYIYDFLNMWHFFLEVVEIQNKPPALNYPLTVNSKGKIPLKNLKKMSKISSIEKNPVAQEEDIDEIFDDLQVEDNESYSEEDF